MAAIMASGFSNTVNVQYKTLLPAQAEHTAEQMATSATYILLCTLCSVGLPDHVRPNECVIDQGSLLVGSMCMQLLWHTNSAAWMPLLPHLAQLYYFTCSCNR